MQYYNTFIRNLVVRQYFKFSIWIFKSMLLLGLIACSNFSQKIVTPTITLAAIEPLNLTLFEQSYRIKLRVYNPNDIDLPINKMNYVIDVNGSRFAQGNSSQPVSIPAYGNAVIETDIYTTLASLIEQVQKFGKNKKGIIQYRLLGKVEVENWYSDIPFDYEGVMSLNQGLLSR